MSNRPTHSFVVPCPTCKAPAGASCRTWAGLAAYYPHAARSHAVEALERKAALEVLAARLVAQEAEIERLRAVLDG